MVYLQLNFLYFNTQLFSHIRRLCQPHSASLLFVAPFPSPLTASAPGALRSPLNALPHRLSVSLPTSHRPRRRFFLESNRRRPALSTCATNMPRTYVPTFDISAQFPALQKKTTVVLHPRATTADLPAHVSKIGGHFYWPLQEPWPRCPLDNQPMAAILQLTKEDVPELGFPEGKNLFQLLWCPTEVHEESDFAPFCKCVWRDVNLEHPVPLLPQSQVPPLSHEADEFVLPKPCTVSPERIDEYASVFEVEEMDENLSEDIDQWIMENSAHDVAQLNLPEADNSYQYSWSVSPSTKVGGHVSWVQATDYPTCDACGETMEHFLSISSLGGYGGGGSMRWYPLNETRQEAMKGDGMSVNGGGSYYVFVCRRCPDLPFKSGSQR